MVLMLLLPLLTAVAVAAAVPGLPVAEAGQDGVGVERLAGPDRIATAAEIATRTFAPTAETATAVVARGDDFADALAGASLAGAVGGPVLLTRHGALPGATRDALQTLEIDEALVLGGHEAVSETVVDALGEIAPLVDRVSGQDRFATAAEVARLAWERAALAEGEAPEGERVAFVASGSAFADALAAAPAAYALRAPVLLTRTASLPETTAEALRTLELDRVVVLGGEAAVNDGVVEAIRALDLPVERLAGDDRTGTAVAVADWLVDEIGFDGDRVLLARGDDFPDALTLSARAGELRAPIVLSQAPTLLGPETRRWLGRRCALAGTLEVAGGPTAVGDDPIDVAAYAVDRCGQPERAYTVRVSTRGQVHTDPEAFRHTALGILDDERGWSLGGRLAFVETDDRADVEVVLASPSAVEAAHPVCHRRYSCRVGNQALINDVRWREGAAPFMAAGGDLPAYRRYVVNHEVGHWLGFGHHGCGGPGQPAPVMQQQSIRMNGCEPNGWPLAFERDQLAAWHLD